MEITLKFDPTALTADDLRILTLLTGVPTATVTVTAPAVPAAKKAAAEAEVVEDDEPEPEVEKPKPAKKTAAKKTAAKKPEPEPEPEDDDSDDEPEPEDEDAATVRASCEAALLARLGTGGPEVRTEVREILATVGARRLSEVDDSDLPRLLTALQA